MPHVNCIVIWERKAIEVRRYKCKDNKVEVSDSWKPSFTLDNFLPEIVHKRFFQFWKRGHFGKVLILREGQPEALNPVGLKFSNYWTQEEAKKQVDKMIAQSLEEAPAIKTWQFIVLMLMTGLSIAVLLFIASKVYMF